MGKNGLGVLHVNPFQASHKGTLRIPPLEGPRDDASREEGPIADIENDREDDLGCEASQAYPKLLDRFEISTAKVDSLILECKRGE